MTDFHHNVINALDFHVNLNLNTDFDAGNLEVFLLDIFDIIWMARDV